MTLMKLLTLLKKKKNRIICAKLKYFLANILLLFSLTNLNMFQGQDFRGSFSTICWYLWCASYRSQCWGSGSGESPACMELSFTGGRQTRVTYTVLSAVISAMKSSSGVGSEVLDNEEEGTLWRGDIGQVMNGMRGTRTGVRESYTSFCATQ